MLLIVAIFATYSTNNNIKPNYRTMLEFITRAKNGTFRFHLPTSLREIPAGYLSKLADSVKIADNYSLVALCFRESITNVILSITQKKQKISTAVVPLFVRAGKTESEFINNIKIGQKIVVPSSSLELGYYVAMPQNELTLEKFRTAIIGDGTVYQRSVGLKEKEVYFLDFKLIPNCEIRLTYNEDAPRIEQHFIEEVTGEELTNYNMEKPL